jgi:biopolymer transport protein ExbD
MNALTVEMNTTPLIDVLLVLLIFLVLLLPRSTHETRLDQPAHSNQGSPPPIVRLEIDADGEIFWNSRHVESAGQLHEWLRAAAQALPAPLVKVVPDRRTHYENVLLVLAEAQRAHVGRLTVASMPQEIAP